jgi:hypothetical protein
VQGGIFANSPLHVPIFDKKILMKEIKDFTDFLECEKRA